MTLALLMQAACGSRAQHSPSARPPPSTPVVASPAISGGSTSPTPIDSDVDAARALHDEAIVVDTHDDVTQRLVLQSVDLGKRQTDGDTDLPRMREGGLDAEFLSVWVAPQIYPGESAYAYALRQFDAIDALIAGNSTVAALARTSAEVRAAVAQGKTAFLIGVEGGHCLGDASDAKLMARLKEFYDRGARYMTLTWSNSNRIGGSSGDDGSNKGLTAFGKKVVHAMNDLGMIVDISHVSDTTFRDAVLASKLPVLASHSSARALADHPRNMTDDMLLAVRENNGAVCVNFGVEFVDASAHEKWSAIMKGLAPEFGAIFKNAASPEAAQLAVWKRISEAAAELPSVPASRVIDHIEHIARVAGVEHVCLGSDFDGVPATPVGLEDVSGMPYITRELLQRGFSSDDIRKVLGENVLRVLAANERGAARP